MKGVICLLTNFTVLMLGGDARYLEVLSTLAKNEVTVYAVGFDNMNFNSPYIIKTDVDSVDLTIVNAITLPVAGTNDNGKIETTYGHKSIYLTEEILTQTPELCTIYSGTANSFLNNLIKTVDRKLVTLFSRDDIAILNSIPTAEGTLKIAIENTDYTIHGSSIIVLGFGRVGMTIARLFSSVGAYVTVAVRDATDSARIREMGLSSIHISQLTDTIHEQDICINTVPHLVLNESVISCMHPSAVIIDIASAPGGTDFSYAKKKGINTIHALGIPGKTAPKTAGNIIAEVLYKLMQHQMQQA